MELTERVDRLEQNYISVIDRLSKVEDKSAGAWNTIREINGRMDKLEKRMETMEADVKQVKSEQQSTNKSLKVLIAVVSILCVISAGFFVYIWRNDAELAKSLVTLGSAVAKIVA